MMQIKPIIRSKLTITCLGDVMIDDRALNALGKLTPGAMMSRIWKPLEGVDIVLANLEAPITNSTCVRENKRYNLKTRSEALSLFDERFILGLANNHILDYGEIGLLDTIEALDSRNIPHAGVGRNLSEAREPAIIDVGGLNIGIICAADPRFQSATETSPGTFPAIPELLKESIQEVRKSVGLTVISIHAGTEYIPFPSPNQLFLSQLCLEEGAQVVDFHHAHCVSGVMENERGVVFYGTGNYVFPYRIPGGFTPWKEGAAWRVTFNVDEKEIENIDILPVMLDDNGLPKKAFEIQSLRILTRIKKYSYRIKRKKHLLWWRLWEMIRPVYIWLSIVHYADIGRRQGFLPLLKTLVEGVKSQFTNKPC